jgi:hypothetical protein
MTLTPLPPRPWVSRPTRTPAAAPPARGATTVPAAALRLASMFMHEV